MPKGKKLGDKSDLLTKEEMDEVMLESSTAQPEER